jgi:pilus assembly protein CpaF
MGATMTPASAATSTPPASGPATTSNRAPTASVYEELRRDVQDRLGAANVDRDREPDRVRALIESVVERYQRTATVGVGGRPLRDPADMVARLVRSILGYGALDPFLDGDQVEVEIRGADICWKDHLGRWHTSADPTTEAENRAAVDRLLQPTGRALTEAAPIVSTQVLDRRVRLTASIPPISDVLEASLRFYRKRFENLRDLVGLDTMSSPAANLCWALMRHPKTGLLVSGRPQSGKTTFANALLRAVPASHKVCVCEDTRELDAPLMHISYRQTKPRTGLADDQTEKTLRELVEVTLRSSPERIVVGEVRGEEAAELVRAANAGSAVLSTLHANSAADALDALSNAALLGDHKMPSQVVRSIFSRTIDVVIHLDSEDVELTGGGEGRPALRQVMEIAAVSPMQASDERFTVVPIFEREDIGAPLVWTQHPLPPALQRRLDRVLRRYGTTTPAVLAGEEVMRP